MPSYDSFMCPNCEGHFRVIWPEPLPIHYHHCSKIKIKCPDCGEVTELVESRSAPVNHPTGTAALATLRIPRVTRSLTRFTHDPIIDPDGAPIRSLASLAIDHTPALPVS